MAKCLHVYVNGMHVRTIILARSDDAEEVRKEVIRTIVVSIEH